MSLEIKSRYLSVIPKILVLWVSFLALRKINSNFIILAFFAPIFYGIHSKSSSSYKEFFKSFLLYCIIAVLGVLSLQNLYLVITLNLLVTFSVCYYFCTEISPNGYILYLLEYMFIQMRSFSISDIPLLILVLIGMFLSLFVILKTKDYFSNRNKISPSIYKSAFKDIANFLNDLSSNSEDIKEKSSILQSKINNFYSSYYSYNIFPSNISLKSYLDYYMLIILKKIRLLEKVFPKNLTDVNKKSLTELSLLFKHFSQNINKFDNKNLLNEISLLKENHCDNNLKLDKYIISILNTLENLINKINSENKINKKEVFSRLNLSISYIKNHGLSNYIKINKFRLAFALRMTLIATFAWTISYLIENPYSYWLPLNTILLIKPAYEESKKISLNRILGNVIGCFVVFIILNLFKASWIPMTLFFSCSAIYHLWKPGKWSAYIWSSIYGTSIITYRLSVNVAVPLKLSFIISGFILGILANKFLFTKPKRIVFTDNFNALTLLLKDELDLILRSSYDKKNLASLMYLKIHLHFTHQELFSSYNKNLLDKNSLESFEVLNEIYSDIENIFFMLRNVERNNFFNSEIKLLISLFKNLINKKEIETIDNLNLLSQIRIKTNSLLIAIQNEIYSNDYSPLINI